MKRQTNRWVLATVAANGAVISVYFDQSVFAALFSFLSGAWFCAFLRVWADGAGIRPPDPRDP